MGTSSTWNPSGLAHRRLSGDRGAALRLAATVLLLVLGPHLQAPRATRTAAVSEGKATTAGMRRDEACERTIGPQDGRVVTRCD